MNRIVRAAGLGLLIGFAMANAGRAQESVRTHGPAVATKAILAADRAFNDRSAAVGAGKAFGEVMDPMDGLAFQPGADPVRGAPAIAAFQQQALGTGRLAWTPAEVFASKGGDMGVTWGRWTYTPPGAPKPLVTGRYQTTWRKDATGRWKGLTDIGLPDPPPKPAAAP